MRDCFSAGAKMLAMVSAAAFVAVTVIVLFLFNAEHEIFNPESYKRALLEQGFYDELPAQAAGQLASSLSAGGVEELGAAAVYFRSLKPQDWEIILSGLFTQEWLQSQMESAIDQFFSYLDSDRPALEIIVSLAEPKIRLQGEPGMRAFQQMLNAQPPCTQEQLLAMSQAALMNGIENMPICQPPEDLVADFRPEIQAGLNQVATSLPNEVNLGDRLLSAQPDSAGISPPDPRANLRRTRALIRISPLLPAALLLLITICGVRSLREWLLWWGIPLLLAGLAALGAGLIAGPLVSRWITEPFITAAELPPDLAQAVSGIVQSLAGSVLRSSMVPGGILALVGLAMALVGLVIRPRSPGFRRQG
jgi:hypothetical protein